MFVVPEVLWGSLLNAAASLVRLPVRSIYQNHQVFNDNPYLAYLIMFVELIAVVGLLYFNMTANKSSKAVKYTLTTLLILIALSLLFLLYFNFMINKISLP